MIKLYKKNDNTFHYHEAWIDGENLVEHWGVVGNKGEVRTLSLDPQKNERDNIIDILRPLENEGYKQLKPDEFDILVVEYKIKEFGTESDIKKIHELKQVLNELLGWTGLGSCDGSSSGQGNMEVACYVVDFKAAKIAIETSLKGTPYGDYNKITNQEKVSDNI